MARAFLTPEEVGRRLAVSPASVRRWIVAGQLDAVRLGNGNLARYRLTPEAVDEFVRPAHHLDEAA